jgi:hypothetical protein
MEDNVERLIEEFNKRKVLYNKVGKYLTLFYREKYPFIKSIEITENSGVIGNQFFYDDVTLRVNFNPDCEDEPMDSYEILRTIKSYFGININSFYWNDHNVF